MNVFSHGLFVRAAFVDQLYDQAKFLVRRIFFSRKLWSKNFRGAKISKVELFSLLEAFITNLVGTLMRYANLL